MNCQYNAAPSIVRLRQRDRIAVPEGTNVNQLVPVFATWAEEEAADLIDFRFNGGKHDFKPAISAFPHDGLRRANANHSADLAASQQQEG